MSRSAVILLLIACSSVGAQTVLPPPGSDNESCMEVVKTFLSSSEYNGLENLEKVRSACINADPRCVKLVGDSLSSSERRDAAQFLPLVRGCAGGGKAECYASILDTVPSFDRSTAAQAAGLLKKCEGK